LCGIYGFFLFLLSFATTAHNTQYTIGPRQSCGLPVVVVVDLVVVLLVLVLVLAAKKP
jgi:hypothetical protein